MQLQSKELWPFVVTNVVYFENLYKLLKCNQDVGLLGMSGKT